jgi:hypothetical protein
LGLGSLEMKIVRKSGGIMKRSKAIAVGVFFSMLIVEKM